MKKNIFKTMLLLLTAGMSVACSSDNDTTGNSAGSVLRFYSTFMRM